MIGRSSENSGRSRTPRGILSSLGGALMLVLLTASPVWGVGKVASSSTANATGGGALLLAMGAGVLILGGGGFTILTWSRRKRAPQQCASEREALELAEQALRYWEGALAHLQNAARTHDGPARDNAGTENATESQASLLEKAMNGRASALEVRDERQLDLIRCMASGTVGPPLSNPYTPRLEPLTFENERSTDSPTPFD